LIKKLAILSVSGIFLGITAACGGAPAAAPAAPTVAAPAAPAAVPAGPGDAQTGKGLIVSKGCTACHKVAGVPEAVGEVGPDLTGVAGRPSIAGGALTVSEANLKKWLKDPPAVKAGTLMPNLGLTDQEIGHLVAFLITLK